MLSTVVVSINFDKFGNNYYNPELEESDTPENVPTDPDETLPSTAEKVVNLI